MGGKRGFEACFHIIWSDITWTSSCYRDIYLIIISRAVLYVRSFMLINVRKGDHNIKWSISRGISRATQVLPFQFPPMQPFKRLCYTNSEEEGNRLKGSLSASVKRVSLEEVCITSLPVFNRFAYMNGGYYAVCGYVFLLSLSPVEVIPHHIACDVSIISSIISSITDMEIRGLEMCSDAIRKEEEEIKT